MPVEGTPDRTEILAHRGVLGLLREGVDTPLERGRTVPATALLLLTWTAVVAYVASTGGSTVGAWLTRLVPPEMAFTGAVVALGLSALVAWSRDARPLALLATMLLTYVGGMTLSGRGLRWAGGLTGEPWVLFVAQRLVWGVAVVLPMLLVYLVLRRWWGPFVLGVGSWTPRTRLARDGEVPATWSRQLLSVVLWIGVPFFVVMQVAAGFATIRSGTIVALMVPAVIMALVNASVEEAIFRGFLQPAIVHCAGRGRGLWLQGAFFGAHHIGMSVGLLATLPAAVFIGLGGVIFGKSVLETRGLGWAIAAHAVFDIGVFAAVGTSFTV